jgi:hypothetical protein
MFTTKALVASALALVAAAQDLCSNSDGNVTGLINTDTNVAFVQGYYGLPDPTLSEYEGIQPLPWAYPLDKCTMVLASDTKPYWMFTCQDDGTVLAANYNEDNTCTGDVVQSHTLDMSDPNNTLVYNCGAGTTEAWFSAQLYIAACQDTAADLLNTYGVVGEGICELTLLDDDPVTPGYANFYCDKQGMALNTYMYSADECAGALCSQGTIDYGTCEFLIAATVNGAELQIFARPLECMSAQDDICHSGECADDGAAAGVATTVAVVVSAVAAAYRLL